MESGRRKAVAEDEGLELWWKMQKQWKLLEFNKMAMLFHWNFKKWETEGGLSERIAILADYCCLFDKENGN